MNSNERKPLSAAASVVTVIGGIAAAAGAFGWFYDWHYVDATAARRIAITLSDRGTTPRLEITLPGVIVENKGPGSAKLSFSARVAFAGGEPLRASVQCSSDKRPVSEPLLLRGWADPMILDCVTSADLTPERVGQLATGVQAIALALIPSDGRTIDVGHCVPSELDADYWKAWVAEARPARRGFSNRC